VIINGNVYQLNLKYVFVLFSNFEITKSNYISTDFLEAIQIVHEPFWHFSDPSPKGHFTLEKINMFRIQNE